MVDTRSRILESSFCLSDLIPIHGFTGTKEYLKLQHFIHLNKLHCSLLISSILTSFGEIKESKKCVYAMLLLFLS